MSPVILCRPNGKNDDTVTIQSLIGIAGVLVCFRLGKCKSNPVLSR
jgi:hypothetical protein